MINSDKKYDILSKYKHNIKEQKVTKTLKYVFFLLVFTCLIMVNIVNTISMIDCLNNNMKPCYDLTIRFEVSGGLTECWNALMVLKLCSNEVVILFLNSQVDIGPDCCRAIDIITRNC